MAVIVHLNGVPYTIPQTGEVGWGDSLTNYLVEIASGAVLTLEGGAFPLAADVNFGPTFGVLAPYFKSGQSNPASTGVVRLTYGETIAWRNSSNTADLALSISPTNTLLFNGAPFVGTGTVTSVGIASSDLSVSGSPIVSAGSITLTLNTVPVAKGGTGAVTANGALGNLLPLQAGHAGQVLATDGAGNPYWTTSPAGSTVWGAITGSLSSQTDLAAALAGKQPQSAELTGISALSTTGFVERTGAGAYTTTATVSLATQVSGNLPVGNLNSGTGATSTSFWRGDGLWAIPPNTGAWGSITGVISAQTDLQTEFATKQPLATDLTTISAMSGTGPVHRNSSFSWTTGPIDLASEVSGNLPVTNLNSGTGASSSTAWFGDGTWKTIAITTTLTGDVTGSGVGTIVTTLANSGVSAGTYGASYAIPVITVDAKGRITTIGTAANPSLAVAGSIYQLQYNNGSGNLAANTGLHTDAIGNLFALSIYAGGICTFSSNVTVAGLLTGNSGLSVTGAASITGNVTIAGAGNDLIVGWNGTSALGLVYALGAQFGSTVTCGSLTVSGIGSITAWGATFGSLVSIQQLRVTGGPLDLASGSPLTINSSAGTSGQVLKSNGPGTNPTWSSVGSGTVTSVGVSSAGSAAGAITIGSSPITSSGTITITPNVFTAGQPGVVPLSGGGTVNFLRADGAWTTPAGGGTVTSVGLTSAGANAAALTIASSPVTTTGTISITANAFTSGNPGIVPASGGGATKFLRADGIWSVPSGSGGLTPPYYLAMVATSGQTVFNTGSLNTVANSAGQSSLQVFVNGVKQMEGSTKAYTVTGAHQITFTAGVVLNSDVEFYAFA